MRNPWEALNLFSDSIFQAASPQMIGHALLSFLKPYGIEACLVAVLAPTLNTIWTPQVIADLWPSEWSNHYFQNRLIIRDPCAALCLRTSQLFNWRSVSYGALSASENEVMKSAEAFGLRDGFCLPVHGANGQIGVVSLAGRKIERQPSLRFFLQTAAFCGYQQMMSLRDETIEPVLTRRQAEVCGWAAAGKTAAEIAMILGISETTAERHLRDSRERLAAANAVHTIVTAIKHREIRI